MQPRFYADENVPLAISAGLKSVGIDLLTVQEARLRGHSDREQLDYAFQQRRAIITHDVDFLALVHKENVPHYGILFFTSQAKIGEAIEEIERVWLAYSADDLKGIVLFLPVKK